MIVLLNKEKWSKISIRYEPRHDKSNKMSVRPAKTDQSGHSPSLITVFAGRPMGS